MKRLGSLAAALFFCLAAPTLTGCNLLYKDAIAVSDTSHDFRSSRQSWNLKVWNSNASLSTLYLKVATSDSWIHVTPTATTSKGASDVKILTISVSRQGLAKGKHEGTITLTGVGAKEKQVAIKMYSDGTEGVLTGDLNIWGVAETYSDPYLLDFTFSLRDKDNVSVIGEPNQFRLTCMENGVPVSPEENPPYLAKASAKQFRSFLVLDYTASMASLQTHGDSNHDGKSNAIDAMEAAIKNVFLPALSADTLIGVYEFNRETQPERVCSPSADKQFVAERIDAIWTQIVRAYWGPSRCWDAVYAAVDEFGDENRNDENRNVIFLSDGRDTSSTHTREQVIDNARKRGVRIHAIGFGQDADVGMLQGVSEQTNGQYYSALAIEDLDDTFLQIIDDLNGQYALRWATLKRAGDAFVPSFQMTFGNIAAGYTAPDSYAFQSYAGDELNGVLRIVPSRSGDKSTYFLRASYLPRYIWELKFFVKSPEPFTVEAVDAVDGGLCAGWSQSVTPDEARGGTWITLMSPSIGSIDSPLPFAAFGPILRFDFNQAFEDDVIPFDTLYVDNTIYDNGQVFTIQGWENILP